MRGVLNGGVAHHAPQVFDLGTVNGTPISVANAVPGSVAGNLETKASQEVPGRWLPDVGQWAVRLRRPPTSTSSPSRR